MITKTILKATDDIIIVKSDDFSKMLYEGYGHQIGKRHQLTSGQF